MSRIFYISQFVHLIGNFAREQNEDFVMGFLHCKSKVGAKLQIAPKLEPNKSCMKGNEV
jgi:hypothetical protein